LLLKVRNAIQTRKRLLQVMYSTPEKVVTESADERFLKQLKLAIENQISDPNLGMNDVAEHLNIKCSKPKKRNRQELLP